MRPPAGDARPARPRSGLTYAIGDIHGCLGHLDALLWQIADHAEDQPRRLVFLGDYVDRGPDSAGVVARVRALEAAEPGRVVCLLGNHEHMMLDALTAPARERLFLFNGGEATLSSYGVDRVHQVPRPDLDWLAARPRSHSDARRVFVHAGLNPAFAWDAQPDDDLVWIRDEFLDSEHDWGRFVVHGHTPRVDGRPDVRPRRVNLDTGAIYGGRLTAGIFGDDADGPVGFLSVP